MLVLEVVINGRASGQVAEFIDRDGALYVEPSQLNGLGLVLPRATGAEPILLASLPNIRAEVNEARQRLEIVASDLALQPTELHAAPVSRLTPLTRAEFGALLNYDAAAIYSDRRASGGALVDLRLFGPYGVLESSALVSVAAAHAQKGVVRLDTTYTFTQESRMRRWRLGDVLTGALPWSRAVRLGGAQVASDFGLRPDLVTYPLPLISSSAAVPSTVTVLVNGINQLSESVEPGPFAIRTLPIVTGAGDISVIAVDALGRQTLLTLPFYASAALLKPGLSSYSIEIGAVRQDYGLPTDRYSSWAANQSSRLGVTDWLTLESHAEAMDGLGMAGAGGAMAIGTLGIANVAIAGSIGGSRAGGPSRGGMVAAGFQRVSPTLNVSVSGTYASAGFRDVAAEHGAAMPKSTLNASLGYQLGRLGSIGLAYSRRALRAEPSDVSPEPDPGAIDQAIELITGSYSVAIAGFANLYATGFKDLGEDGSYGVGLGLSFGLGGSTYGTVETSLDSGHANYSVGIARAAHKHYDFGYRLRVSEGSAPRRSLEGEFLGPWGRLSAGIDQSAGELAGRVGARGAVVFAGGQLFASDQIYDSFAVVSTGDVGGVPVMYENRLVGRTNKRGKLLIPSLRSFQDNRLTVDSTMLPPDIEVARTEVDVRPGDRSGVSADFGIRRVHSALLTLHDRIGRAIPLGSIARVAGAADQPVGHDGAAYVTGLRPSNRMEVALPDGTRCAVQFEYRPVEGDIPVIGPLSCR
ncbi:MAG TPA: fimbria/pilus outer membrane usher protein [Sphingomicrobium sp.]|nr:fimbria/pilus outer membrane usher protein [Sphingomicrobium sp.]